MRHGVQMGSIFFGTSPGAAVDRRLAWIVQRARVSRDGAAARRRRGRRDGGALGLELAQPSLDSGLPEAPVSAEANVWNQTGAGLGPDPVGSHAEPLGNLLGRHEAVHSR